MRVGVVLPDGLDGPESIVVSGAVRSTVQVWLAGVESVLPAGSVARTSKVWLPAPSAAERLRARAGRPAAAVDAALEGRAGLGGAEREGRSRVVRRIGGVESIVVAGGVRSTIQV